ncbi:MAG TPA: T9SS type A sorting domain-containing protein [Saprospiraceae bacterium]|nr:T9SS type A sorting domain-containing protein [Saprospiraceae bacterium]
MENYFFVLEDTTYGSEPWVTDGTEAGTHLFKDINPAGRSNCFNFVVYNNKLFFSATDNISQNELWATDGTLGGTRLVKDIFVGGHSSPRFLTAFKDKLYFTALKSYTEGRQLWSYDDNTDVLTLLTPPDADLPKPHDNDFESISLGNLLFFAASYRSNLGNELYSLNVNSSSVFKSSDEEDIIRLYPIPSRNEISIQIKDYALTNATITISNSIGKIVKQIRMPEITKGFSQTFDISKWNSGIYIVNISSKELHASKMLVRIQ